MAIADRYILYAGGTNMGDIFDAFSNGNIPVKYLTRHARSVNSRYRDCRLFKSVVGAKKKQRFFQHHSPCSVFIYSRNFARASTSIVSPLQLIDSRYKLNVYVQGRQIKCCLEILSFKKALDLFLFNFIAHS